MSLALLNPEVTFISTWFCDVCDVETGQDDLGSVWCACD
jgi:hypothetical protein